MVLPPDSLDRVFLCDTYHHLEYPKPVMASILRAMKKGAVLVVLDFERIPGKSRKWVVDHVRAGKQTVREEMLEAGLAFQDEVKIAGFKENYLLRFVKK